jgi:AraC-like DNA-binding protein
MQPANLNDAVPPPGPSAPTQVRLLSGARALLAYCEHACLDSDRIVREAGLTAELQGNPDAHLTRESRVALWRAALSVSGDPDLHLHVAERAPFGAFRVADFVCATAPCLSVAFQKLAQLLSSFDLGTTCTWIETEERACLSVSGREGAGPLGRYEAEYVLAVCYLRARFATDLEFTPLGLELSTPPPSDTREVERLFGCTVRYECPSTRLWLRTADLQRENPRADPELLEILEQRFAQTRTAASPLDPILARLEQLVTEAMGCDVPQLHKAARRLGLSPRTLQRRLRASGTSFSDLVEQVRERHARQLLKQSERSLTDISDELGFSEQSAFNRAFKRWTGTTPSQFRAEAPRG